MFIYTRKLTFQPKAQKQDIPQHTTNYRWLMKSEFKSFGLQHKKLSPKQLLGWRFPFYYVSLRSSVPKNIRRLRKYSYFQHIFFAQRKHSKCGLITKKSNPKFNAANTSWQRSRVLREHLYRAVLCCFSIKQCKHIRTFGQHREQLIYTTPEIKVRVAAVLVKVLWLLVAKNINLCR